MVLSLYYHNPVLPSKTQANPPSLFFTTHKTLPLRSFDKPTKFPIKCSATQNPGTKSKTHLQKLPKTAIQRIADKLRSLGIVEQTTTDKTLNLETETRNGNSPGEIFIPLPNRIPKFRVGHTMDTSWSSPENPVPEPGSGPAIIRYNELRNEVNKQKGVGRKQEEKVVPSLAELKLSKEELRRLRTIGIGLRKKLKIGKAGITEGIVNGIHERWRNTEVVKIVCEDLCRLNMKRTHDLLERKTGGLVVWRSGSKIILYSGPNYKYPYFLSDKSSMHDASPEPLVDTGGLDTMKRCSSGMDAVEPSGQSPTYGRIQQALIHGVGSPDKVRFQLPGEKELVEEADRLLDGLGPRFTDWWGYDPQPVDADLLPATVPDYRRPFRLLPYGVKPTLTNDEMTTLRRLGRPLPCHFALGRNRKLQGLAAAIVKLWEKCEIAKIAVKRGVQNTNSELMAEELKWLTGGSLLSRDKDFIVLYRGKDFLPPAVSSAIEERRKQGILVEKQRTEFSTLSKVAEELKLGNIIRNSGDNIESGSEHLHQKSIKSILQSEQRKVRSAEGAIRRTSKKLSMALEKKAKAEELLAELEKKKISQQPDLDKEGITEEERHMLRKVGLRMRAFLLMGRRGVFAGTVENMHLHWKYRELVKIISKQKSIEAVHEEAQILEAESGGILVAVERVSKGHAIIIYRGKNYERPTSLRPKTLLTKREALKRSLEAQRRESLKLHVLELTRNISKLKIQLAKDEEAKSRQSVDESGLPLVEEKTGNAQSAKYVRSDSELELGDFCQSVIPSSYDVNVEVKEETDNVQSAKYVRSDSELELGDNSQSVIPTLYEVNVESRKEHGSDSTCVTNDLVDATIDSLQATQQDKRIDLFSTYNGTETCKIELGSSSASSSNVAQQQRMGHSTVNAENCSSDAEPMESSLRSAKNRLEPSFPEMNGNGWNEMASSAVNLSNRDRLLLRKQALAMKKRPVLAVGRSNIVTGVAKTIKAHFQKHPLAIVNVKGRAKGTSVQEVVSKLQEATGAVLVSQEPSKVILYRGWGAEDESGRRSKKNVRDKSSISREVDFQPAVSSELLAAIRLECGLQDQQEDEAT